MSAVPAKSYARQIDQFITQTRPHYAEYPPGAGPMGPMRRRVFVEALQAAGGRVKLQAACYDTCNTLKGHRVVRQDHFETMRADFANFDKWAIELVGWKILANSC